MRIVAGSALVCTFALAGCGGGGGDTPVVNNTAPPMTTISGVAAMGKPLAGADVVVWNETFGTNATSDATGRYSTTFVGSPPVVVTATYTFPLRKMYSFGIRSGTVNVTPFTHLLTARLLGKPNEVFGPGVSFARLAPITDAQISTARQEVVAYLLTRPSRNDGNVTSPVDASAVADFISGAFQAVPGNAYDAALDRLAQTMMETETLQGVAEHMLYANDAPADLTTIMSLDFEADCTITSTFAGAVLPSGRVNVSLKPNGVASVGSFSRSLQAHDRISFGNIGLGEPDQWFIAFGGDSIRVDADTLGQSVGKVTVLVSAARGSAECRPVGTVPLGARLPSRIALVRLFALAATRGTGTAGITCSPSPFPGILDGANVLLLDRNGALRVNDRATGYAVHVPSMRLAAQVLVTPTPQGLAWTLESFNGDLQMPNGYDVLTVRLTEAGAITSARFDHQRGGQISLKLCPA